MCTRTQEFLRALAEGGDIPVSCCMTRTQVLIADAARRVNALDAEIQEMKNNPDVVDIVGTNAELVSYDTSKLSDNDIIKVLQDETRGGATTYYRWHVNTHTWEYIGMQGPFYTKSEVDTLLAGKQDTLTIDDAFSADSENPVQNKVIYAAIGDIETILHTLNIGEGV